MRTVVIDASALAAVVFGEDEGESVLERMAGATLTAPHLLWSEMCNVCVVKSRRYPDQQDHLLVCLSDAAEMPISLHAVDHSEVAALALRTQLSAYDASYLWLARHLGVELVTLDEKLGAVLR